MMNVSKIIRGVRLRGGARLRRWRSRLAPIIRPKTRRPMRQAATPGSQQDFVVNVGDRVFFETDSTELTPQSRATLDKQAQWLTNYSRYAFTVEGHADERGTREYNIALGARRAQAVRDYLVSRGIAGQPHAYDLLRQGAAGRGLRRHFLLVAEPPRGDGAQRQLLSPLLPGAIEHSTARPSRDRSLSGLK